MTGRGRRETALAVASAVGYGVGLAAVVILATSQSYRIFDSTAYWMAGQNVLHGRPLYDAVEIGTLGAYFYPPVFAQLWAPLTLLPEPVFSWLWRAISFGCILYLAGGWRNAGLWLLFPLTLNELANPNVTLLTAATVFAALRGNGWLLPLAAILKIGPAMAAPYLWIARPETRRTLVRGTLVAVAVCVASAVITPDSWRAYVAQLGAQSGSATAGAGLIAILPTAAADFALRLAAAGAIVVLACLVRSDRLAFVATTLAVPALWLTRFLPLLALPRIRGAERPFSLGALRRRRARAAAAVPESPAVQPVDA